TTLVNGTMKTMAWLKLKFAAGVGVAALIAGGAVTVAVSHPKDGNDGLTPQEIAKQTQDAYAALTSYSGSGTVVVKSGATTLTNTFHIRLQRPEFYRVEWSQTVAQGFATKGVAWSSGDGHFMQMSLGGKDAYPTPQKRSNRQSNLSSAAGVSSSASTTISSAFFGEQSGNLRLVVMGAAKPTREPDAIVGSVDCHVFTSVLDSANQPGGGKLPNNMGSVGTITITFWIGKKDHLIRQTRTVMDTSQMKMPSLNDEQIKNILSKTGKPVTPEVIATTRKIMEEGTKQARLGNVVFTETHENIVVNQKFSPTDFAR
ncbi:MAG TPA: hypothetical protein VK327_02335, partial [Candidatus Paceibacterota bacterium]|nr:hypothetical protein [Candidatus Paceibacterota bacterium]